MKQTNNFTLLITGLKYANSLPADLCIQFMKGEVDMKVWIKSEIEESLEVGYYFTMSLLGKTSGYYVSRIYGLIWSLIKLELVWSEDYVFTSIILLVYDQVDHNFFSLHIQRSHIRMRYMQNQFFSGLYIL